VGKLVIVADDPVTGTDKHNVSGTTTTSPPVAYTGVGDYAYNGSMTGSLSDFVTVDGTAVALVSSESSLNPGEDAPGGGHDGLSGSNFVLPIVDTSKPITITDSPLGKGTPGSGAGSGVLTVDGVKVLLDADKIDTCDGLGVPGNSSVAASGQDFVTCSE
jgi:hypothetical protein